MTAHDTASENDVRRAIHCQNCDFIVTFPSLARVVSGSHEHTFMNPHGFMFHIACYSEAPGCRAHGEISDEFSWFPGYVWQIQICANCSQHLGWSFRSPDDFFVGLIVNRLS